MTSSKGEAKYEPDSAPGVVSGKVNSCGMVDRLLKEILHVSHEASLFTVTAENAQSRP